jgi:hypothetical protein
MNFPISSVNRPGHPTGATLKICAVQVYNVADAVSCMWKVPESRAARARSPVREASLRLCPGSGARLSRVCVPAPAYDPKRRRGGARAGGSR